MYTTYENRSRKLTTILLTFLFVFVPIFQAVAAEQEAPVSTVGIAPTVVDDSSTAVPVNVPTAVIPAPSVETESQAQITDNNAVDPSTDSVSSAAKKPGTQTALLSMQPGGGNTYQSYIAGSKPQLPNVQNNTGSLVYEYPLTVPPGRNSLQPDLKLSYNSQDIQPGSIFGYGWSINIPYIERINRKGSDKIFTEDYFSSSLGGELIAINSTTYGPKVETGDFLKYEYNNNSWLVTDKSGTKYKFGYSTSTRQDASSGSSNIFKWMLEEVRDTNDNFIRYTYYKDSGQIYPSAIYYTGSGSTDGVFEIDFLRQTRNDSYAFSNPGFNVNSNYRINEIDIKVNSTWTRKYNLAYTALGGRLRSLLYSITESGQDESSNVTTLPATTFNYQNNNSGWTFYDNSSTWVVPASMAKSYIMDVNGDGKNDIVKSYVDGGTVEKAVYLNNGSGWTLNSNITVPTIFFENGSSGIFSHNVQATDVNGDGLTDLIFAPSTYAGAAYINNGSGWTENSNWYPPVSFFDSQNHLDTYARMADINGDGLPDIVKAYQSGGSISYWVYINNGNGWTYNSNSSIWVVPVEMEKTYIMDVNGDNLADFVTAYTVQGGATTRQAYINNGKGWTYDSTITVPVTFYTEGSGGYYSMNVQASDLNGDGLLDLVFAPSGYTGATYINNGHGWTEDSNWYSPTAFFDSTNHLDTYARMADVRSDSLPDVIKAYDSGSSVSYWRYFNTSNNKSELLNKITYSQGGYTDVVYKTTPLNGDNPNLPAVLDTVRTLTHNDGQGNTATTTYLYDEGKYYYSDAYNRKLSGFHIVTKTDDQGNYTKTYFHQGDTSDSSHGEYSDHIAKAGQIYRIEVYDVNNNLYAKTINKWDRYNLGTNRDFVKLVQKVDSAYDGDSTHKDSAETYTYSDTNGNLTQKVEWGEVTGSDDGTFIDTGTDKYTTDITYATNTTAYILGLPSQKTVTDQSINKAKETKYYYDSLTQGSVDKGNLTKQEDWKTGTTYINSQKTYNVYGLVTVDTDPRSKTTSYTYDSYYLYPVTVTNALSQATQYTYDYSSGKVKQTTDPSSRVFQNVYDGLDRLTEEKQPDITTPSTLVTKATYTYTDDSGAVSVKKSDYLDSSTIADTYTYFDGLARQIQVRKEAEGTNYSAKDYAYNNLGLLDKETLSYFSTGTSKTSFNTNTDLRIAYTYDAMQRIKTTVNVTGTTTNAYSDWKLTITDVNSKTKDLYKDAYGNLVQVDEHNSGNTYTTQYIYNYLGNLTKITDSLSNIRNFTYDGLGRRLTAEDLHDPNDTTYGTWTYVYDDTGNLTQKVDPKSQTVNYTYDDINRVLNEDYTGQGGTEVTNTYDNCTDGVGRLCSTVNSAVTKTLLYNALGLVKRETSTLNLVNYQTDYDYDRQGNQILITNPDSSQVKYLYNSAGLLNQVQRKESTDGSFIDVVTNFDYSPLEQVTITNFANGQTTTNTYNSARLYRLSTKVTIKSGGTKMQDLTYTYDNIGNITRIVDASATNSSKTVDYTYDDLYRLASATATNVAQGQQTYTENYAYSAIGNITSKTGQGSYTYAGNQGANYANPQAVTAIDSTNLTYDNNGNLLTKGSSLTNTWDYNNRITQTVAGSTTVTYTYDPNGQRVKYANGTTTSYYPTKYYNTDGTTPIKHVFANNIVIATIKNTGSSATVFSIHTDHLTGSNVVTNSSGTKEELMDYFPFGSIRLDEQAGSFKEQRKFTGHEYDQDTGLSYMDARYYDPATGRFVSEDQVFLAIGDKSKLKALTHLEQEAYLKDPQGLSSYTYARNNPLRVIDPNGDWFKDVITSQQSWSSFAQEVGDVANYAYQNNSVWQTALDHPVGTGAVVGVGGGLTAYGISAGITYGLTQLGLIGGATTIQADRVVDYTQKYGQILGNKMNQVAQGLKNSPYNFSDHAVMRIAQRVGAGNEGKIANILGNVRPFEYFHEGVQKLGYYDTATKTFIGQIKGTGTITTVITEATQKYVNNLIK